MKAKSLLKIKDLTVSAENKIILDNINLEIKEGEAHLLTGPNGSGKSSLVMFLAGQPKYQKVRGEVIFDQKNLLTLPAHRRVQKGLWTAHQNPPAISGVTLGQLLKSTLQIQHRQQKKKLAITDFYLLIRLILAELGMADSFLERDFNGGFSGGEKKKIEFIFYLLCQPRLAIFDEIDSGLDLESQKLINRKINHRPKNQAIIFISHNPHIKRLISFDSCYQLKNGELK